MRSFNLDVSFVTLAIFVRFSKQQFDPISDFCRRFAHQTTVIDNKLFIDGGLINYGGSVTSNTPNYTNTGLQYADLNVLTSNFPTEYNNLTKSSSAPSVQGGILWRDEANKLFYLYGGEYFQSSPSAFALWYYDILYNSWNKSSADSSQIQRLSFGAGTTVDDRALGYYYGGWQSNNSIPGWSGSPTATSNLLIYDMIGASWTNVSGPDTMQRAEGVMLYIPASDAGMLVTFGGIQQPAGASNGSYVGSPMEQIFLYDIANAKWYVQNATGSIPPMRRRFCAGVTWAQDQSSYNIYFFGGASTDEGDGYGDVYILSLPSFTWIQWYPSSYPHHSLTCNVINEGQMIVMGGTFPNATNCDVPSIWGQHNMNLGENDPATAQWYQYLPNVTSYIVPTAVMSAVGGGPTGGATLTAPSAGFYNPDLQTYFTRKYTPTSRTPTRYIPPTATSTPSPAPAKKSTNHTGAIAGGVVGGVAGLLILAALIWFCLRRRNEKTQTHQTSSFEPARPSMGQISRTQSNQPQEADSKALGPQYGNPQYSPHGSPPPHFSPNGGQHGSTNEIQQPQPYFPPPPQIQPFSASSVQLQYFPQQRNLSPKFEMPSVRSPVSAADSWRPVGGERREKA